MAVKKQQQQQQNRESGIWHGRQGREIYTIRSYTDEKTIRDGMSETITLHQ